MFDRSCSISVDHSQHTSTPLSPNADKEDREALEAESIVVDDDGELHELRYPSPGTTTSQMDVDELTGDETMAVDTTHETSMTSSKPLGTDVGSGVENEKLSSNSSAVGPTSFYSSTSLTGKGKQKADMGRPPQPFPLDVVDVSCSDDGEQDEVDELLNERDPSGQSEQPT